MSVGRLRHNIRLLVNFSLESVEACTILFIDYHSEARFKVRTRLGLELALSVTMGTCTHMDSHLEKEDPGFVRFRTSPDTPENMKA